MSDDKPSLENRVNSLEHLATRYQERIKLLSWFSSILGLGLASAVLLGIHAVKKSASAVEEIDTAKSNAMTEIKKTADTEMQKAATKQLRIVEGNVHLKPTDYTIEVFFETGSLEKPIVTLAGSAGYGIVRHQSFRGAEKDGRKGIQGSIILTTNRWPEHDPKKYNLAFHIFQAGITATDNPIVAQRFE
jgi:hypothetical protein